MHSLGLHRAARRSQAQLLWAYLGGERGNEHTQVGSLVVAEILNYTGAILMWNFQVLTEKKTLKN